MLGELPPPPPLPPRIATDPLADVPPALPLPKIRQGEPYVGKPIAAFLEFARQQDLVETQLELRGQLYGQLTAKPLLTNPTGPRPEKRNDGFNRKGPQGLQNVASKASTMLGELPPPPPLPPRIATDPLADVPPALPLPKIRPVDQASSSASHVLPPVHPFPPLPPPFLIPGLPVDLSYGPVPPPPRAHAYPPRVEAPYYRPKAKSRYPWKEPERVNQQGVNDDDDEFEEIKEEEEETVDVKEPAENVQQESIEEEPSAAIEDPYALTAEAIEDDPAADPYAGLYMQLQEEDEHTSAIDEPEE
eukprot:symbB.v1.2.018651.t2/scaffold1450.1/size158887/11